ncbi:MAG: alpha/beta fold hydrolase [Patescibacteria group bacterium]|nr:alpha/beta fold hydrolase [Patescibacteria group bacterium]
MKTKIFISLVIFSGIILSLMYFQKQKNFQQKFLPVPTKQSETDNNPLNIQEMRSRSYPGSDIKIEETLRPGSNYDRYIASYKSDGLKIYALLTVPQGQKLKNGSPREAGWPVIVFNHGYIPPREYQTTERYIEYVDAFASHGYIVFKPDYRGNGNSEGEPEGAYYSPAYAIDDLNAISSIKKYKDANPDKIGVWGHSMGGNIALRDLVVRPQDIKAAVIWGGVVGSYEDLLAWRDPTYKPPPEELALRNRHRAELIKRYGTPQKNPTFWHSIDPTYFVSNITTPIQLHHGEEDEEVPVSFSKSLYDKLKKSNKTVEYYIYPGSNHNISQSFNLAMQRSLEFFDKYLK